MDRESAVARGKDVRLNGTLNLSKQDPPRMLPALVTMTSPVPLPACELCGRRGELLTRHHLIPRARHNKPRTRRAFGRTEPRKRLAWLCRPCHDHVHALFTEKTLGAEFNTLALLAAHPEVSRFVAWIRAKPAGFRPPSNDSRRRR